VPVCSTVGEFTPSSPTQEEKVPVLPQVTVGCVHELETLVNAPAWPASA
jgi:hypothetical protein